MRDTIAELINDHPIGRLKEKWGLIYECANVNTAAEFPWQEAAEKAGFMAEKKSLADAAAHVKKISHGDFVCFGARPDIYLPTEIVRIDDHAIFDENVMVRHPSVGGFLFFDASKAGQDVTYIKYNQQRDPKYRLQTEILKDADGKKTVKKTATHPDAIPHLYSILDNGELLHDLYRQIWLVPVERDDDTVYFMFVEGESLLMEVDFVADSPKVIVKKIREAMKPIFDFKKEYVTVFKETEAFRQLFGSYPYLTDYRRRAVTRCNLDCNFDNFGRKDGDIYCFDYEWAADFPVPIDYLKVRTLRFLYESMEPELSAKFGRLENFIFAFGYIPEEYNIYTRMEEALQQRAHGPGFSYRYTTTFSSDPVVFTPELDYHTPYWKWTLKKIYGRIFPFVLP